MTMANLRAICVMLVGAATAVAQGAPAWTADEATMAALLPELARGGEIPLAKTSSPMELTIAGYRFARVAQPVSAGPGYVCYAWPAKAGAGVRTFAITDRGIAMLTEDRSRAYGTGNLVPLWNAIVASGGAGTLAQALTTPGKGEDGQFWQPLALAKTKRVRVTVRDGDGKPIADVGVAVGPASWFGSVTGSDLGDGELAVGHAFTDGSGVATLTSVPVHGARLALSIGRKFVATKLAVEPAEDGFTVVADGKLVAGLQRALGEANESAAIATLKNVSSAQSQMQASAANDANNNGAGEYGFFAELAGSATLRTHAAPGGEVKLDPPVMSASFRAVRGSCVVRNGYVFQLFLPGKDGWLAENCNGGAGGVDVDPRLAEVLWCLYAWPLAPGRSGSRAFYIDQSGTLLAVANADGRYGGFDHRPRPEAAQTGGWPEAQAAANKQGNDGRHWMVVD